MKINRKLFRWSCFSDMNIYLIGFMGSGKSTIGRMLAKRLDYRFIDLDEEIERDAGCKISEIFAQHGEAHFRGLEIDHLKRTTSLANVVVSTGGGAPCHDNNMELMNANGLTVYLKPDNKMLADRLMNSQGTRPLIANKTYNELLGFIEQTLTIRDNFYTKANVIIANPSRDVSKIVEIIKPYLTHAR